MKIFITGKPGSGKTTLIVELLNLLRERGIKVCGFITREIRKDNERVGFQIVDLKSGKEGILAHVKIRSNFKVSKYGVDLNVLDEIATKSLEEALAEKFDLVIVDEIGKMELCSKRFEEILMKVLNSKINLVATLHLNFLRKFGNFGEVIYLDRKNFREVLEKVKLEVLENLKK